mmetsp:Transcript_65/g.237  ORF Transcript_65/g.237 Transcript_65/m.237 type:complete len:724 (-) Transcript_65:1553-3724(-)
MGKGGAINRRKDRGKKKAAAPKAEEPLDWVQCTGCDKWRRIPASIVEKLGEEDEWFCKENPDKAMASCDAPEETYEEDAADPAETEPMETAPTPSRVPAADLAPAKTPAAVTFAPDTAPALARSPPNLDLAPHQPAPSAPPAPAPATGVPKPETPVPIDETLQGSAYGDSTGWRRPPLSRCSPEDFMLDFMRFTDSQGDDWEVVWDILDNSLRRSGRPMDALGFYKEICWRGGFVNRESAKKRIKMPDVFKQLHNHYVNHTYTDIGNNLLNTYERYFWAYERAHPEDVSDARCVTCEQDRVEKPGQMLRCDGCGDWHHAECAAFDPTDSGVVRGVVEIVTSFVCARCRDAARRDPKGCIAFESERVTRTELETRMKRRAEVNFDRHLAMQRRRGRRYDPSFVRPTRDPDAVARTTTTTTGKYDDKPIGTWAAAKHYVPPVAATKRKDEGERRPNLLDDGWVPATAEGRAVFGVGPGVVVGAANERVGAERTGAPKPDVTVGEWLAAQGKLGVSGEAAKLVLNQNPAPTSTPRVDAMEAAGEAEIKEANAEQEASAKFGASPAAATATKEPPPPVPEDDSSDDDSSDDEPHPLETLQKVADAVVYGLSTNVVDGPETTPSADESRARRDGTAPTPPARLHDPDAKYPGKVPNDGTVQTAGPSLGHGFNAAEANAMAALQLQANAMAAQVFKRIAPDYDIVMREVEEEEKASEEPAGAAPAGAAQ